MMSGRYFLAIDLSPEAKTEISAVVESIKAKYSGAKWVKEENYHITLLFLGELESNVLEDIVFQAGELAGRQLPFTLVLTGLGSFPNPGQAKVMYIGAGQGADNITALARELHALAHIPVTGFRPHLTVARFRQPSRVAAHEEFATVSVPVRELTLFSSTLTPAGPIYSAVGKFSFSGIARGE